MIKISKLTLATLFYAVIILLNSPLSFAETLQPKAIVNHQKSILVIGDSLSAAYGLPEASGWVDLLSSRLKQQKLEWIVNNASISGETTSGGAERIEKLLDIHRPQIVIIELGGNDGLRGFPLKVTYSNLEKIIALSQQQNAKVILSGIHLPPNYGKKYDDLFYKNFIRLSEKYDLVLIPFLLQGIGDKAELMQADGIHPKETAQTMLLNNVWPHLQPLL